MIKTVLFDVDNTLYSYDKAHEEAIEQVYDYCRENFRWDRVLTEKLLYEAQEEERRVLSFGCAALHNRLIRYQLMLEKQGKSLFPHVQNLYHAYWDTLLDVMNLEPGILQLIRRLKERNLKIGIATDMTAYMQYEKLKRLDLLCYVDFIVSSEEVGVEKPDKRLFYRCVQKAACEPCECLMVGDSLEKDIKGAMSIGMRALWYQPAEKYNNIQDNHVIDDNMKDSHIKDGNAKNSNIKGSNAENGNIKEDSNELFFIGSQEEVEILTSFWDWKFR